MITLITGLPGNGKTLFALWWTKAKAEKETREVYYHNIKDLTLPWTECDPEKWMDLPAGSIIVLDECQFVFAKKPNGSKLPDFYEQLATHRHRGVDIVLITQHPSLIDNFVRQLVGQHFHAVRKFGMERNTIYEWSAVNASPTSTASQKSAIPMKWAYPKEVYGYYKSAEVHTVKRAIPAKIFLAAGFVVALAAAGYWALGQYQHRYDKPSSTKAPEMALQPDAAPVVGPAPAGGSAGGSDSGFAPGSIEDAQHYIAMQTPRVAGLPQTAPRYDELTKPSRVPVPAACLQIGTPSSEAGIRCKCYTQDGTPMDVGFNMCVSFAQRGFFLDFNPDPNKASVDRSAAGVAVLSNRPEAPIPDHGGGSQAVSFAVVPDHPRVGGASSKNAEIQDGPPNNRATRAAAGGQPNET